ncbi:MAG: AAA family ATPase [Gemmatimonadetes bacterium]|nr:MAG: AAA family ATPase [Gemmatimonadota bacterium]
MPLTDALHDLELLIRARHGLIHIDSDEEDRIGVLLRHVASRLDLLLFTWTRVEGLKRIMVRQDLLGAIYDTELPLKAFQHIAAADVPALYHFRDLRPHLEGDAVLSAQIKVAAERLVGHTGAIVVTGSGIEFPPELAPLVTRFSLPGPSEAEYRGLLERLVRDHSARMAVSVELTPDELTMLVRHLSGLTLMESEKILTKAIIEDGRLGAEDIQRVIEAKRAIVERDGLLEYYPVEDSLTGIADLRRLKAWLAERTAVVRDPARAAEFGLTFPKGVLLLGVPGCGKSLSAKAVAAEWQMPLLKLDPSNLYNKFIGESERNFKRAMDTAERMAPVVLWIDELEKAFATGGSEDGGVSQRILGTFLSWMQDRRGEVFVVATANDVSRLPPEFLRKGRFDEIFFVDLPDAETRAEIFRIHLEHRNQDADLFDLEALAAATEGFSGSEIEEVVVSGLYGVFAHGGHLSTESLLEVARATHPLSVTMAERVEGLRAWARDRAVAAN